MANSQIVSFTAPEGAQSLEVNAYMLADDGTWDDIGGTSIDAGGVDGALSGAMSIHFDPIEDFIAGHSENFTIGFNISSAGSYQFQSEPVSPSGPITASGGAALTGFQATDIGAETPVAIMAYGDTTRLPVYSLEHYYEPSIFDGMDIVLAVTMEFSDAS